MWVSSLVLLLLLLFFRTSLACQAGCQCSTGGTVVCSNAGLRTFPILLDPRTTRLDLSSNQLTRFTADDLSVYPNLEWLSLTNNSLSLLPVDVFSVLPLLRHLDLSGNKLLSLPNNMFRSLKSLQSLNMANNELQLTPLTFAGLASLEELNLSANRMSYLPPTVFRPLTLKTLDLSDNKLLSMPASLLSTLPSLEKLLLKGNLLSTLESGMFSAQKSLQELDLAENLLSDLEDGAFFGMDSLAVLNLTSNQISRLPGNAWPLPRLYLLDLSDNLLVVLDTASFDSLPALQYLNISQSRNLRGIHMSAFVSLPSLAWLSLAGCSLSTISPNAFATPSPLRFLDLRHNQLTSISSFVNFNRIPQLFLEGNPWHCDCSLRQLKLVSMAACSSPPKMKGLEIGELSECSYLQGMFWPLFLGVLLLLLAVIVLILAVRRPRSKMSVCRQQHLLPPLVHKDYSSKDYLSREYVYERSFTSPSDSAYESPTSAFLPKMPAPSKPPNLVRLPQYQFTVPSTHL